jgi:hypothetical protein
LEKGGRRTRIKVLQCVSTESADSAVEITSRSLMSHEQLTAAAWNLVDSDHLALALELKSCHPSLSSKMTRVSAGPATGKDSIFVVPEDSGIEPSLLHPTVKGRNIHPYLITNPHLMFLAPYMRGPDGAISLVDIDKFPRAKRYLELHRDKLESRHCVKVWGKAWYEWHDKPQIGLAGEPRIFVPDLASSNRFAVDTDNFLPGHSIYYLCPRREVDPFAITAILNSSVTEFILKLSSPLMKDGFVRYRQQFLAGIPIPDAGPRMLKALSKAARMADVERVEDLVAHLFKLSDAKRSTINQFIFHRLA